MAISGALWFLNHHMGGRSKSPGSK